MKPICRNAPGRWPLHGVCAHRRGFATLLSELAVDEATLLALPQLAAVLTYHVAGVEAMSSNLTDGQAVHDRQWTRCCDFNRG